MIYIFVWNLKAIMEWTFEHMIAVFYQDGS